ncbi:hypothetical protein ANO11243_004080 [Dothideomycetidae sp. 11243]|nr:hypothetical protein ANO11243_004080 [fungal sp. No.11243]
MVHLHLHDLFHRHGRRDGLPQDGQVSHGGNVLQKMSGQENAESGISTVVSVIYVTESATFTGPTAGYITQTGGSKVTSTVDPKFTSSAAKESSVMTTSASTRSTVTPTVAVGTPVQATNAAAVSSTSSPTSTTAGSGGKLSIGPLIGIALAGFVVIALVAGAAIFFLRKKKRQQKESQSHNLDNEKTNFGFNSSPKQDSRAPRLSLRPVTQFLPTLIETKTDNSRAPRLSLRPVTQFLPTLTESKVTEITSATGGLDSFPAPSQSQASYNPRDRRSIQNKNDAVAARLSAAATEKAAENAPIPVFPSSPKPALAPVLVSDPFADRQIDSRPVSRDDSRPTTAMSYEPIEETAQTTRNPPSPNSQQNTVHRVQLDFKPSMDDELELRAGQVVRIVHEYDDGWALCMYMDRSKQGVAPRTCLSKLALKPRPNGPPPGMAPLRPQSPALRQFSGSSLSDPRDPLLPAPLSPGLPTLNSLNDMQTILPPGGRQRAQSNAPALPSSPTAPNDHPRSASTGQSGLSPTGSPVRKPVPGQAI